MKRTIVHETYTFLKRERKIKRTFAHSIKQSIINNNFTQNSCINKLTSLFVDSLNLNNIQAFKNKTLNHHHLKTKY